MTPSILSLGRFCQNPVDECGCRSAGDHRVTGAIGDSCVTLSCDIEEVAEMTDVLVRDVPDDVVAALEARAARLGLSRSEFLRRRLAQEAAANATSVSGDDLVAFAETFADLADPEVIKGAWE
jgi:plasmid stability protein